MEKASTFFCVRFSRNESSIPLGTQCLDSCCSGGRRGYTRVHTEYFCFGMDCGNNSHRCCARSRSCKLGCRGSRRQGFPAIRPLDRKSERPCRSCCPIHGGRCCGCCHNNFYPEDVLIGEGEFTLGLSTIVDEEYHYYNNYIYIIYSCRCSGYIPRCYRR